MSAATSTPVNQPAAQSKVVLGTVYDFTNHRDSVTISYATERRGPPPTLFIEAATLSYSGPEGHLKFAAGEIQLLDSPMGSLVSVVLETNPIGGNTNLSILLPPVSFGTGATEQFKTYLVKTKVIRHPLPETPGAGLSYEVEPLKGVATQILGVASTI